MAINPEFWQGKRVLLTGHTGFKGSWLALWLSLLECEVLGYSLAPDTSPSHFDLVGLERDLTSVIADIRDFDRLLAVVKQFDPEIIFHMAAQPFVRRSYRDPLETFETNVMGTAHVLQAARSARSLKAVLNITTDKCYQNREWNWGYRENEPMGGADPYSASKACSELVTTAFRRSFFESSSVSQPRPVISSARAGNVFGGGDWGEDRLIPDVIRSIESRTPLAVRNPNSVRPWQFVLEPLRGYLVLAERMCSEGERFCGGWNFGPFPTDEVPVSALLNGLKRVFGEALSWQVDDGEHPHEASLLRLDITKARVDLGWQPHWGLEKGLQETGSWYQSVLADTSRARELSLDLLARYISASTGTESTTYNLVEQKLS